MKAWQSWHVKVPAPTRYAIAVGVFGAAIATRWSAMPLDAGLAFLIFYPAVPLAFLLLGIGPGLLMVALSALAGYGVFSAPFSSLAHTSNDLIAVGVFLLSALVMRWLVLQLQGSLQRQQQALQAVHATQAQMQRVLDDQTDAVIRFDAHHTVLFVNNAFCSYFGVERGDVIGTTWAPLVLPEDLPAVIAAVAAMNAELPTMRTENRVVLPDGQVRWMEWANHVTVFTDGRPAQYQGSGRDIQLRKQLEAELRQTSEELEDLYQNSPFGHHSLDAQGRYLRINDTELGWLGRTREELIGKMGEADFYTDEGKALMRGHMARFVAGQESEFRAELDLLCAHGVTRRVSVRATRALDAQGRYRHSRTVLFDITEAHGMRRELQRLAREQHAMLDNDLVGIFKLRKHIVTWKNRGFERLLGFGHEDLIGQPISMVYASDASHAATSAAMQADFAAGRPHTNLVEFRRQTGATIWVRISGTLLPDSDGESIWIAVDVTESQQQHRATEQLAFHDPLTRLPNRLLLAERIDRALSAAARDQQHVAVCFLDLDGFKPINDQNGHEVGDAVLRAVAARLQTAVRTHDTVARIGGDEFVVLLTELHHAQDHEPVVNRIRESVCQPMPNGTGAPLQIGVSIGVAVYPDEARDADSLLRLADTGMYRVKGRTRSGFGTTSLAGLASFDAARIDTDFDPTELEPHLAPSHPDFAPR